MKDIFDNPYVPSRTIKDRARHATLPGVFPTRKAQTPWVRTRLPLMTDGLIHLETDPRVVKIAVYPPRLRYSVKHDITGRSKEYDVFPDVALLEEDGHVTVLEYVPLNIQRERPWIARRVKTLREVYREEHGCGYALLSELSIHVEPRMTNLRRQYEHSFVRDDAAREAVRDALYRMELPTVISEVRKRVRLPPPVYLTVGSDPGDVVFRRELDDIDRLFTALLQLAHSGEIELDLSRHYDERTTVRWPRFRKEGEAALPSTRNPANS